MNFAELKKTVRARWNVARGKRRWTLEVLECDAKSIRLRTESASLRRSYHEVAWDQIASITAFKRDLVAVDEICLAFDCKDDRRIVITEEMTGWDRLVRAIETHMPDAVPYREWHSRVALPPFEPCATVVWPHE